MKQKLVETIQESESILSALYTQQKSLETEVYASFGDKEAKDELRTVKRLIKRFRSQGYLK